MKGGIQMHLWETEEPTPDTPEPAPDTPDGEE